jgi:hypothetical protein
MAKANEMQVGGMHYARGAKMQHWDMVAEFELDYFQGQITKYLFRWRAKGGVQDLEKAAHYLAKYIELAKAEGSVGTGLDNGEGSGSVASEPSPVLSCYGEATAAHEASHACIICGYGAGHAPDCTRRRKPPLEL